jgi:quercetin dioxygenase-like cupin family protein
MDTYAFKHLLPGERAFLQDLVAYREGQIISLTPLEREEMRLVLFAFAGGEGISELSFPGETLYYVLDGSAGMNLEQQPLRIGPGDAVAVPAGVPHEINSPQGIKLMQLILSSQEEKENMNDVQIKNLEHGKILVLKEIVSYEQGRIASLTLAQRKGLSLTLFAFDSGEGLSTHYAEGDAMVVVLDGSAEITIQTEKLTVSEGQTVVMPATIPHAVQALTPFKMLLTVVKPLE